MFCNLEYELNKWSKGYTNKENLLQAVNGEICDYYIKEEVHKDIDEYVLLPKIETYLFHNSFLPTIYVAVEYSENISKFNVRYSLQKSVRIIMSIIFVICTLFELLFVFLCLGKYMDFNVVLLLPFFMVVSTVLLCFFVFRYYAKRINQGFVSKLGLKKTR